MRAGPATIDIRTLGEGTTVLELELGADDVHLSPEEVALDGPIAVRLVLYRVDGLVHASGNVRGVAEETCGLCAAEAPRPFDVEMRFVAQEAPDGVPAGPASEDEDLLYYDGGQLIDLAEPIRQLVLVSAPMVPRCREGCRGLCPICGTNLNLATCSCEVVTTDPRWEKLAEMLDQPPTKPDH